MEEIKNKKIILDSDMQVGEIGKIKIVQCLPHTAGDAGKGRFSRYTNAVCCHSIGPSLEVGL